MGKISRRALLGLLAALPLAKMARAAPLPLIEEAHPVPLEAIRRINLDASDPAVIWADIDRPEDIAAMKGLVAAVMGDIHRRTSWALGWTLATSLAYLAIYKPFGLYMPESEHFAKLLRGSGVSSADVAGLQRLYTYAHAGCTSVMAWDEARRRMVHFRSLDWPSAPAIAAASRIYQGQRSDGSTAFSAAGILGMAGLLTAVKPGFSLAINFAPWKGTSLSLNADPTFLLRKLMTSSVTSYVEARQEIEQWRPGAPVFISLCGVERGEAAVFEFGAAWSPQGRCHVIPMGDRSFLVQTNHFDPAGPYADYNKPQIAEAGDEGWDAVPLLSSSLARKTLLEQALAQTTDLEEALAAAFLRPPVWNHETAQWVRMQPGSGEIEAWVRQAA